MAFVWGGGQSLVTSAESGRRGELPPGVWMILQDGTRTTASKRPTRDNLDSLHSASLPFATIPSGVPVMPLQYLKADRSIGGSWASLEHWRWSKSAETLALMNEAYEDEKLSRTQVYFWYKRFKDGRKSIADDSSSGRPLTSTTDRNIGQVRDLIVADRKNTIDNISEILGISCDFSKRIITGNETWCFLFDPQTEKQSLEWHTPSSPRTKKVCLDKSKGKVLLVVFFDYQGLVYYEFIKEGNTINKQAYKEILVRLRDAIRRKRNKLFKSKQWKLLQDNAPAHRAIIVQNYLAKHSVSVLPHPPYSSDIAPCDFFSFPKLKMTLKGRALFIVIRSN
ncbi:hypothetical protein LAZ67_4003560 [Cordylochernes scorpioides]|uniref:Mos1 transposase HTH domain-containing protein n=1 Tax=Cordylochernes scorpioides TaxID=51811 RepID=A0ABY6KDS7_9ARAC|nr:hypothetical protein LAZ67_4003560 [Cordylochernes scorpioides]